jgi:general stress protein 26
MGFRWIAGRAENRSPSEEPVMTKRSPESLSPDEVVNRALAVVQSDRFPYLATVDVDQPRVRPVSPLKTDGFTVYIANLRSYGKTKEIQANPKVELCYLDDQHDQVRITGVAEVVTERAILEEIWESSPLLRKYLGTIDNPELILYRVRPTRVRFMKEWALNYFEVPFEAGG